MQIKLIKEPDNEHDKEAIKAVLEPLGTIGYVGSSILSAIIVKKTGMSMHEYLKPRLYDKIGKQAIGTIKIVTGNGIICAVSTKKKK